MNPLQTELHRLYYAVPPAHGGSAPAPNLVGAPDLVRALVMEITRPPNWRVLSLVWQGVQAELDLPAPGIAVSGTDALQLWFALEKPMPAADAHGLLASLRDRFMPDIEPDRVRLFPAADASPDRPDLHARPVPAEQGTDGNWSAFVAQDLAAVFQDTPWLDIRPGEEGQAALLRSLKTIDPQALEVALKRLRPASVKTSVAGRPTEAELQTPGPDQAARPANTDPRGFLLQVMNDINAPLALRIDAARALLPHTPAA
jgi:hypothetical protein